MSKPPAIVHRALDITVAVIAGLFLLPLMGIAALAIWISLGRPILFRQTRIGKGEKSFQLVKFRTMQVDREGAGIASDAQRLTPLGEILRNLSIDEIPQLWNVLKGEMAMVGPRPLLPQYLPRYSKFQRRRHEVRPGVTGWAQINGRNDIAWEDKFRMDVWYVDHRSIWLDLRILFLTAREVLCRRGVSAQGHATASEFQGSVAQE
jgi:lipopolysaccharide/colanic/teichoic acid biosynthesis glycosyltransferase